MKKKTFLNINHFLKVFIAIGGTLFAFLSYNILFALIITLSFSYIYGIFTIRRVSISENEILITFPLRFFKRKIRVEIEKITGVGLLRGRGQYDLKILYNSFSKNKSITFAIPFLLFDEGLPDFIYLIRKKNNQVELKGFVKKELKYIEERIKKLEINEMKGEN